MSHFRSKSSQQGSLPLALLVAIIVGGIVVVLVARLLTSQRQVQFDQSFHGALPAAEAGLEQAKFWLNTGKDLESATSGLQPPSDFADGERTVVRQGELDGRTYEWFLTRRDGYWEANSTAVDARGRTEVDRHLVSEIRENPVVSVGAFADLFISLSGANTADSYNSGTGDWCTGTGYVGSNGPVMFTGSAGPGPCADQRPTGRTVDRVLLYDWDPDDVDGRTEELPGGERCGRQTGPAANPTVDPDDTNCKFAVEGTYEYEAPDLIQEKMTPSIEGANLFIEEALGACTDAGLAIDDYQSTVDGTELQPADGSWPSLADLESVGFDLDGNFYCYDNLLLDADTTISTGASINDPVIIFVDGNVRMAAGNNSQQRVSVGCGTGGCTPGVSTPVAGRLWIFVRGNEVGVRTQSEFAGVLWAPQSVCGSAGPGSGGGSIAQADFYGSMICGEIAPGQGGWRFHYDESLAGIGNGEFASSAWREQASPE